MIQEAPMPCCGAEPPERTFEKKVITPSDSVRVPSLYVTETTDNSRYGADPKTNTCRACGADQTPYLCESPPCRTVTPNKDRFCGPCQSAYDMGQFEQIL